MVKESYLYEVDELGNIYRRLGEEGISYSKVIGKREVRRTYFYYEGKRYVIVDIEWKDDIEKMIAEPLIIRK